MNIKGQGHSLTFVVGHSDSIFSIFFSLETAETIEAKFYVEPPWDEGMNINTNDFCHMTEMAIMPIYGKNKFFFSGTKRRMTLKLGIR